MITQLNPGNLGPTVRAVNEKLMAAFIQADLPRRVGLDTRRSVVLYDGISCSLMRWTRCPTSVRYARCITRHRFATCVSPMFWTALQRGHFTARIPEGTFGKPGF